MKFLLAVSAIIAVAVAGPAQRNLITPIQAGPAPVILPEPIIAGPAINDQFSPVDISPALIDFPLSETGELIAAPAPAAVVPSSSAPLVQIILNINQAAAETSPVINPNPVHVPRPEPVQVDPVQVIDTPIVAPVEVIDAIPVPPTPVQVVDVAPVPVEPVLIGTPIIPAPAVVLPEQLN